MVAGISRHLRAPVVLLNKLLFLLAFTRIPGNAISFWIRKTLHWSRGKPELYQESKDGLFAYLKDGGQTADSRATDLGNRYKLGPLALVSTVALYRKNLYLIDTLEKAAEGLSLPAAHDYRLKALDVGAQDWHYVFGLERWLTYHNLPEGGAVSLKGIELDGYGIYSDFHSRRDYAVAYAAQTGNAEVCYEVGDFLKSRDASYDIITVFYPFVTRYQLLLWGLPLRFFSPRNFLSKAAAMTRPGGWLLVYCHTKKEQDRLLKLGSSIGAYELLREGPVKSNLVDFYEDIQDRHFSIWKRI